jgi:DNA-binding IclR family transcriptional regulator
MVTAIARGASSEGDDGLAGRKDGKAAREHRTVNRVTTILEAVGASPQGERLSTLADRLHAPKSSVFGLVKGLVATGYLVEERGVYVLGPAIRALLNPEPPQLLDVARPLLEGLVGQFDETVMLATQVGDSIVYVATVESSQLIKYAAPLRVRRPLYPTSTGKCLLAYSSPRRREQYLKNVIDSTDVRERVSAELDEVRQRGVAFNRGETVPDVAAVAAPVIVGHKAIAAVAIAGPTARMLDKLDPAADAVRAVASAIAAKL